MHDLPELVLVNGLVVAIGLDLEKDGVGDGVEHSTKNFGLELCIPLLHQAGTLGHLDVKAVEVLEESLHPPDHDLVVFPPQPQLIQEFLTTERL